MGLLDNVPRYFSYEDDLAALRKRQAKEAAKAAGQTQTPSPAPNDADAFETVAIGDVPNAGPVKWLVRGLWTDQAVGPIGGEPKTFKSFLSAHLAVCIASGKKAFDRFEVDQGRVLMFNAEDRPSMTRRRVERMCNAMDLNLGDLDLQLINVPALRLDDPRQMAKLRKTVERSRPKLLVLDPLRNLHGLDENDAMIVSELLAPLRLLQREYGCAVMLVHHMAKKTETERRPGQRLRGSSAFHGWLDSALYLSRASNSITITPEHRDAPETEPLAFKVREATDKDMVDKLWLELVGTPAEASGQDDAARMLEILKAADRPLTMEELRKAFGKHDRADAAIKLLASLKKAAFIPGVKEDANGRPRKYQGWVAVQGVVQ
jgi:hypothetical protein